MNVVKKEWHLIFLILLPFSYLGYIYNSLPNEVPIHWDLEGQIDGYGDKSSLFIVAMLPLLFYLLFSIAPKIDPKNRLNTMGNKYQKIKNILIVFMSILVLYIFHLTKNPDQFSIHLIFVALGIFYVVLGNYFKTIKANYFIGIRTPWTLENEIVWKSTHILGGKLWFAGGMIIVLYGLIGPHAYNIHLFVTVTLLITLIPTVYSYIQFSNLKKSDKL